LPFGELLVNQKVGPYETPYKFTGKESDPETDLTYFGARYYDSALGLWLGVDPLADQMPAWSPFSYCFNNPIILIDPNGAKPSPREAALIAAHVYGDSNVNLEGGWALSTRTFGLQTGNLDNGMRSMIYERATDSGVEFVYAFAGTNDLKDVGHDISQAFGSSDQYATAIKNSRTIDQALEGNDYYELSFVGHSLGGGLAAASAYATGNSAITFNAAGVSQSTLTNYGVANKKGSMNDMIQAYIMKTDPLNSIQNDNNPFTNKGRLGLTIPDVDGTRNYINPTRTSSYYNGHSMDNFLYEMKKKFQCDNLCE